MRLGLWGGGRFGRGRGSLGLAGRRGLVLGKGKGRGGAYGAGGLGERRLLGRVRRALLL
jgi:hypothetical protein